VRLGERGREGYKGGRRGKVVGWEWESSGRVRDEEGEQEEGSKRGGGMGGRMMGGEGK